MFDRSPLLRLRPRSYLRRFLRLVSMLCLLAMLAPGSAGVVGAQPTREESPEEATILLLPYLLPTDDVLTGYTLSTTLAYPNEAEAFESVMIPPPDPRGMEAIFSQFANAGRVVRLRQGFENLDDKNAPEIGFVIAAFRDPQAASRAVNDPRLLVAVLPDAQIAAFTAPTFGTGIDAVAAHTVDQTFDEKIGAQRSMLLVWQRGRLVFTTVATGSTEVANGSLLNLVDLAARADTRIASLPAFPTEISPSPAYMPSAAQRLRAYQALADRLPVDDALGETVELFGVASIPNTLIVLDSRIADAPVSDARFVKNRLMDDERRVLGIAQRFSGAHPDPSVPASSYPGVAVGYHLYADAAGAQEAFMAPNAEMALRINEEIYLLNDPTRQIVTDEMSTTTIGDQTRMMTSHITLDDGTEVDFTTLRWRRGAVELFADVVNLAGTDNSALINKAVESLDAAYTSQPVAVFSDRTLVSANSR
jgi:hypothetical protein